MFKRFILVYLINAVILIASCLQKREEKPAEGSQEQMIATQVRNPKENDLSDRIECVNFVQNRVVNGNLFCARKVRYSTPADRESGRNPQSARIEITWLHSNPIDQTKFFGFSGPRNAFHKACKSPEVEKATHESQFLNTYIKEIVNFSSLNRAGVKGKSCFDMAQPGHLKKTVAR